MIVLGAAVRVLDGLSVHGGSDAATVFLDKDHKTAHNFLAWGSVTMVDPKDDFERENAFAFDIPEVNGKVVGDPSLNNMIFPNHRMVYGGDHWGPDGDFNNVFPGAMRGKARSIVGWIRSIQSSSMDELSTLAFFSILAWID